jgi:hypothetical protein
MATAATSSAEQITMALPAPGQPGQTVTVTLEATEVFSSSDPIDVAVLTFWKTFQAVGQQPTAESVWRHMADIGMTEDGTAPLRETTVQEAVDRLAEKGLVPAPQDGGQ